MNKWLEILIGLILVNISICLAFLSYQWGNFWDFGIAAWSLLKGGILWGVLFAGIIFIIIGISDLKS